jgi:hypothetical protein
VRLRALKSNKFVVLSRLQGQLLARAALERIATAPLPNTINGESLRVVL